MIPYAGIGSRETPAGIGAYMNAIARKLASMGYVLRSGGATGADQAFESGVNAAGGRAEVFVPWRGFSGGRHEVMADKQALLLATEIAMQHHPAWESLSDSERQLMARNVFQVLGLDLASPSRFVLCWTPRHTLDGRGAVCDGSGGTGLAVRVAYANRIPVFHLARAEHAARLLRFVGDVELVPSTTSVQQDLFVMQSIAYEPRTERGLVLAA